MNVFPRVLWLLLQLTVQGRRFNMDGSQILTIKGNERVRVDLAERMPAGLSQVRRFPIIYSGDLIALRRATTSGTSYWLRCHKSGVCDQSACPENNDLLSFKWSACAKLVFKIRAMGKADGVPVDSGDTVTLTFPYHRHANASSGYQYFFHCDSRNTTNYKCRANWAHRRFTKSDWLYHDAATFRIFSRSAVDGTPIRRCDIVGLKFPHYNSNNWLYYSGGYFYTRTCGHQLTYACVNANIPAGFQIFNQL